MPPMRVSTLLLLRPRREDRDRLLFELLLRALERVRLGLRDELLLLLLDDFRFFRLAM